MRQRQVQHRQVGRTQELPPESRQRALLLRILAFIEERLGDAELSPVAIAAAHHISLSYLYRVFEAQHVPVAEWMRRRRLDRARHDLLDPGLRHTPVSTIAARWGFTSAAQFSRSFRAAHGLPPGEYRAAALGSARATRPGSAEACRGHEVRPVLPTRSEDERLADAGADPDADVPTGGPLSRREWEVAQLVGRGMTNPEIAAKLFISRRTVESHLEHIRQKLDLRSRNQVMAWVLRTEAGRPR